MTEEDGRYNVNHDDPEDAGSGIERIGEVLRRPIDERGWRLAVGATRPHGDSLDPGDNRGHDHA